MNTPNRPLTADEILEELRKHTFLDPRWDATFKLLIADEAHPERLVHFLNSLLRLSGEETIATAILRATEIGVVLSYERKVVFDIYCKSQRGEPIIVEFQRTGDESFIDRMVYYATAAIRKEVAAGAAKYSLPSVFVLALMNFELASLTDKYHHECRLLDIEDYSPIYSKLRLVFIELPRFHKEEHELETDEDRWLYALGNMGNCTEIPKSLSGPIFEGLFESARISRFDEDLMHTLSHKLADEGIRQGELEFAMREGREQGVKDGIRQTAKAMKTKAFAIELIAELTGLTPTEVESL